MLTQDEIERRRQFITATDVPQILGKSPWGNAADVYYSKTMGKHFSGNDATEAWPFMWIWNYAVVSASSIAKPISYWVSYWLMIFIVSVAVMGSVK